MRIAFSIVLLFILSATAADADEKAYQLITSKGGEIELGKSVPGVIEVKGEGFALLTDANGKPVAAASPAGRGRTVAFSHGGFLKGGAIPEQPAAASLVENAIRWAGRSSKPKVGVHPQLTALAKILEEAGFEVASVAPGDVAEEKPGVYCVVAQRGFPEEDTQHLADFVKGGGGLAVAATPWAFAKNYPEFSTFPPNQLLTGSGIQFLPSGYATRKVPLSVGGLFAKAEPATGKPEMPKGKPGDSTALPVVAARELTESHQKLSASDRVRLIADLAKGKSLTGKDLATFLVELEKLNQAVGPIVPTKEEPVVPGADPLVDAIITVEDELNQQLPAGQMYAIPSSEDYPGAVPEDAERITEEITIDGKYRGWLSGRGAGFWAVKELRPTGIYAPPGAVIRVTVPGKIAGEGFEVDIGAYGGSLKNRDKWTRYPRLRRNVKIEERVTEISNGLGGLVGIRIPRNADEGEIEITIEGGVRSPLYVHGKTSVSDWKSQVRSFPGPWAELASERMILALPSEYIRRLNNPDEVMVVWNGIIETAAVLVQVDRSNYRAERLVFDRQTSAGSMHSGYPVAAHLGAAAEKAVDASALKREGNWGFFHEYGHNHQHNLWSLPGTGETTCNLWSVYIFEEFIGKNRDETHGAIRPLNRKQKRNAYFQNGRKFESEWSVWTALDTYLLIQEEFGWEPFKKVFDEYNQLPESDWPKTQQEKNDQWVIRLSRACGRNLAPYWKAWNLPMSDPVFEILSELPDWDDHPVVRYLDK